MEEMIAQLDMQAVREHYDNRERTHTRLRQLLDGEQVHDFVQLALGIVDPAGNYSAAEHGLGPLILHQSSDAAVFALARDIETCPTPHHLPTVIYRHGIRNLKISVGTEIAMMLRPNVHWVGNVRTIWSHLLMRQNGDRRRANDALTTYRDGERDSAMDYEVWRDVYLRLEPDIARLGELSTNAAAAQGVASGNLRFLWADAVANSQYERFSNAGRRHAAQ
jgi:hypothetical protein